MRAFPFFLTQDRNTGYKEFFGSRKRAFDRLCDIAIEIISMTYLKMSFYFYTIVI